MAGVHYSDRLEDQAAAAALNSHKEQQRPSVLDEDGKLSSASAATSLKYAQAQDLPSFPSAGLKMSSAGAAASLADSNKKSFQHWTPGAIPAANRAALLAKDYEMDPLWQPELSAAGSKAALLAVRDPSSVEIWRSKGTAEGQSAAGQALKTKPPNAITERNVDADGHRKALMAATGAMAGSRPRAGSTPVSRDSDKGWALKAATSSQKGVPNSGAFTTGDPGFEAARIQNMAKTNVNRQMYGSTPPVAIEVEERNRQDTLRASAIAMAKKMYVIQQTHIDEATGARRGDSHAAANSSHRRTLSDSSSAAGDELPTAPRYENLEEAARKLAQERLAKLRDEHAEYRQYYGQDTGPTRSKLSMRLRSRASTGVGGEDSSDEEQSRRIKTQMSIFQSKVAEVDKKKQQSDRNALLEAAHRNVEARMAKMDEQIFQETGKSSPAQNAQWEQQARERAQKSVDAAMVNVGKVHIGGGKYMDQSEVDAIARARLQPTFDEISDTAEKKRARDVEIRAEQERVKEQQAKEKAREAEVKAELKSAQEQEKSEARRKKEEEKQVSKEQATAEKEKTRLEREQRQADVAAEKDRARLDKEEKRKSVEAKQGKFNSILKRRGKESAPVEVEPTTSFTTGQVPPSDPAVVVAEGDTVHDLVTVPSAEAPEAPEVSDLGPTRSIEYEDTIPGTTPATIPATRPTDETPVSPTKGGSKMKSWFKSFTGSSKPQKQDPRGESKTVPSEDVDVARDESMRDVAMAGRETGDLYGTGSREERPVSPIPTTEAARASRTSSISSFSSSHEVQAVEARPLSGTEHTAQVGRTGLKAKLMKKMRSNQDDSTEPRQSYVTATTDDEDFEEAKDRFEDERLAVPSTLSTNRPASPRASHEHSKFKEEL